MDASGRPNHIEDILIRLHRGQWFGFNGDRVYANLKIYPVDGVTHDKPTEQELNDAFAAAQAAWDADNASYKLARKAEYPAWGEQLDMLFHSMEQGDFEFTEWRNTIQAVKEKYPKGK